MANVCSFEMLIKGDEQSVHNMLNALIGQDSVIVGRGIEIQSVRKTLNGLEISGSCSWSIYASLVKFDEESFLDSKECMDLYSACEKYRVNFEVYSEEEGCGIYEHYKYEDGYILENSKTEPFRRWNFNLDKPNVS